MAHFICPFATDIQHLIAKFVKCLSSDTNKWGVDGTWSFSTRLGVGFSFTVSMKSTAACVCREIGSFHFVPPFYSNWVIVSFLFLLFFLKLLQDFPLSPFFFHCPSLILLFAINQSRNWMRLCFGVGRLSTIAIMHVYNLAFLTS